ncbi:MAG: hypothetical protein JWO89_1669 [Verrucomicrobiaceae bacterium]|nr:hypothetical protein [Verrucomicrobiaceae bacterium]MDB6116778.1 hypothetical protein [Verrucomicrobiaceae bacterium]
MIMSRWFYGVASLVAIFGTSFAGVPAEKKKLPPKRADLFVGNGSASWLPKTTILPSSGDVEILAAKLGSRLRNIDPFGLATFPREGEQPVNPAAPFRRTERITLNQALKTLKLTGISLDKKELLIGGHTVREGDVLMLSFKNEVFLAQIVEMNDTQILFRDVKRQEAGVLPHSLVPHLDMEPMQARSQREGLEGKVSLMEAPTPKSP